MNSLRPGWTDKQIVKTMNMCQMFMIDQEEDPPIRDKYLMKR